MGRWSRALSASTRIRITNLWAVLIGGSITNRLTLKWSQARSLKRHCTREQFKSPEKPELSTATMMNNVLRGIEKGGSLCRRLVVARPACVAQHGTASPSDKTPSFHRCGTLPAI